MELEHAVALIRNDSLSTSSVSTWADLGCGTGLFTRAVAHFLLPGSVIYAVDTNQKALATIRALQTGVEIKTIQADFVQEALPFHHLDGLLMANALHFVPDQIPFLQKARTWLLPGGSFLVVEYDTDQANPWVPYPLSFDRLKRLFAQLGYRQAVRLGERPSRYHRAPLYAALVKQR